MREIKYIVLHCTATQPNATVESIKNYWKNTLKWSNPGYHYLIGSDGFIHELLPEEKVSNGVAGYNLNSVHVSYIGGVDKTGAPKDTRTPQQLASMKSIVQRLKDKYPEAKTLGHRDFPRVKKACPSFDVSNWLLIEGLFN
ncbi:N-acetylmuramoyl-L-alanine amidase [compost metagenome]